MQMVGCSQGAAMTTVPKEPESERAPLMSRGLAAVAALTALVAGVMGLLDVLPQLQTSHEYAWRLAFLPDLVTIAGLVAIAATLLGTKWLVHVVGGYRDAIVRGAPAARAVVLCLSAAVVVVPLVAARDVIRFYRCRMFIAKFDWHYSRGLEALRRRDWRMALQEFQLQRDRFGYLPPETKRLRDAAVDEIRWRLEDVNSYLRRFDSALGRGLLSMDDVLVIQRAACVDAKDPRVRAAATVAAQLVESGIAACCEAVSEIQAGRLSAAAALLSSGTPRTPRVRVCHEVVLHRYCRLGGPTLLSEDERALIEYYSRTPVGDLERVLRDDPRVRAVRATRAQYDSGPDDSAPDSDL